MSTTDPFELNKAFGAMKPLGATPNKIARLTSVAGTKVSGVPKTQSAGAAKKIASVMGQKSNAFGMRTPMTNGRVAGVRTNNAMTDLRATIKPKKKGLFGKAADPFEVAKSFRADDGRGAFRGPKERKAILRDRGFQAAAVGATAGGALSAHPNPKVAVPALAASVGSAGYAFTRAHKAGNKALKEAGHGPRSALTGRVKKSEDPFELAEVAKGCSCGKPCPKCKDCACSKKVAKADQKTSTTGRKVAAALAAPVHGTLAAKKGKRLRATGNEAVGAVAGGFAGELGGGLVGGPAGRALGGVVGTAAGSIAGNNRNQRKGYLKGRG